MVDPPGEHNLGARARSLTAQLNGRREAAILAGALAFGLLVLPFLIWLVGHRALGPYTHGDNPRGLGAITLFSDYLSGLAHGWIGYWVVALGPAVLLIGARLWLALVRHFPRE